MTSQASAQTVDREAALRLAAGRAKANELMPYLGTALFAIKPVAEHRVPTAGVDKRWRMYWNPAFVATLSVDECAGLWLHEVGHPLREHHERFAALMEPQERHPLFNKAGDAAINADLRDAGITLPEVKAYFPERIAGATRGMVAEQMYRLLLDTPAAARIARQRPEMLLLPAALRYDYGTPTKITAFAREAIFQGPTTVTIADASTGEVLTPAPATPAATADQRTASFDLTASLPAGQYAVTLASGSQSATAVLRVTAPSITLRPDHLARGWSAPAKVVVVGNDTRFTGQSTVEVLDAEGQVLDVVSEVACQSAQYLTFALGDVPDGAYLVRVSEGEEVCTAVMPVGMPYLDITPDRVPGGHGTPYNVAGVCEDFTFDATTTIEVHNPAAFMAAEAGALSPLTVLSPSVVNFALAKTLDDGQYLIVATTGSEQAMATLTVGGDSATSEQGQGQGGDQDEDDTEGGEGEADDCGSGAAGASRPWESDEDGSGDDGSVDEGRANMIRQQVARDIQEHAKSRGTVPAGWQRWADSIVTPQVDWRKELNSVVRRTAATVAGLRDYTYARPSRRAHSLPTVVLPSMRQPRPPKVRIVVDTSGSMSEAMLGQCLAEIGAIIARVSSKGGDAVEVLSCDASASQVEAVRKVANITLSGGGGTDMRVGIKAAAVARPRADLIITLTDGETPWPDRAPEENPGARYVAVLVDGEASYSGVPDWMHKIVIGDGHLPRG